MRKSFLLLLLPFCSFAQMPAYYNTIDFNQTGNNLKTQLAQLVTTTHTHELVYTPEVWTALEHADLDPDNSANVFLIYGYDDNDANDDNDRTRDKDDNCHSESCEGLWVREHTYPRSLGNPNLGYEGPGSDAHHLRAIDYDFNNERSNRRYADGSGNAGIVGANFYPGDEWKGDIARMMMYMYLRYNTRCLATTVGTGSTSYSNFGDMPNIFLEWNAEDPVSQYEKNRNTVLQNMQGNRNPFIDNPYLATIIWNGPAAQNTWSELSAVDFDMQTLTVYPTLTTGKVYVTTDTNYTYTVYNGLGQQVKVNTSENMIDLENNTPGIYFLKIQNEKASKTFKLMLQ
jgi:endonuclease I